MLGKLFVILVVTTTLCAVFASGADDNTKDPKTVMTTENTENESVELSTADIMLMCNESFRTSLEYLEELNTTGAFPDETDKTPMCYMRCFLENIGVLKDDVLDHEKAMELAWAKDPETLDECEKEASDRTNPCERAYFMTRCVMMRNIVDARNTDQ